MYISKNLLSETIQSIQSNNINIKDYINIICDRLDNNEYIIQSLLPEKNRRERLLKDADNLLKQYPDPAFRPVLFGIPVGIKDIFRVDGFETKAGSKLPPALFEGNEASSVTKLKNAGALILGKTITTEFAYFQPGPTRNPYNTSLTPGGSSSGSAAAVSCGFTPLAIGTQTIGSITRPAAFCGVFGFKPSFNRIPVDGIIPFAQSADHIGFFTQDLDGVEIIASLLCDNWENNIKSSDNLPVIGIPDGKYLEQVSTEINFAFNNFTETLIKTGYKIVKKDIFTDIAQINTIHKNICAYEMAANHADWFEKYKDLYSKHTINLISDGKNISYNEINKGIEERFSLRNKIENTMNNEKIDVWISPSTLSFPPKFEESTGSPLMNLPWTYIGVPTITFPYKDINFDLPVGIQVSGLFMQDEILLNHCRKISMLNSN